MILNISNDELYSYKTLQIIIEIDFIHINDMLYLYKPLIELI